MDLTDHVVAWLAEQNIETYLVGGCVRDRLLGRSVYDLDVATAGDGLILARRLANHFRGDYYALDQARSTGRALLHQSGEPDLAVDIARFRGADLAADLAGRDFTVNSLAADVRAPAEVIDLHGGLADLQAGRIRPVSDDSIRSDPVRALRAIRQAAQFDFVLTEAAEALIRRDGAELAQVSGERVRDELARLLALPIAGPSLIQLDRLGLLTTILPELEPLRGLAQPVPHCLDALSHSLETVGTLEALLGTIQGMVGRDEATTVAQSTDPLVIRFLSRFAGHLQDHLVRVICDARSRLVTLKLTALLHDTGKAATRTVDGQGQIHFIGHHKQGTQVAGAALRRLRMSSAEVHLAETIVQHHMRPLLLANQQRISSRAVYRFFRDSGEAGVEVLLHALADHRATCAAGAADPGWPRLLALTARMLGDYWERQAERVAPPVLVNGHDLVDKFGLEPGPQIGQLLEAVREAQVSGEVHNRGDALALIGTLLAPRD